MYSQSQTTFSSRKSLKTIHPQMASEAEILDDRREKAALTLPRAPRIHSRAWHPPGVAANEARAPPP